MSNPFKDSLVPGLPVPPVMAAPPTSAADSNAASMLVSRFIQVALGLFVTTMELPPLSPEMAAQGLGFDCDFSSSCRWASIGSTPERWRLARGEPDVLLWLAATGTISLPSEPFSLIEIRGGTPMDMLSSDVIDCQRESSLFSFTYWTIGSSDLEICLLDLHYRQFNCTGMLQSHIQPGKVALKIPAVKHPFRIAIIPSNDQGILVVDDIRYDAKYCGLPPPVIQPLSVFPTATTPSPLSIFSTATPAIATRGLSGPTTFPFFPGNTAARPDGGGLTFTPIVPPFFTSTMPPPSIFPSAFTVASPPPPLTIMPFPAPAVGTPPPLFPGGGGIPIPVLIPGNGVQLPAEFSITTVSPLAISTQFPPPPSYVTPKPIVIVPEPLEPFITTTNSPAVSLSSIFPPSTSTPGSGPSPPPSASGGGDTGKIGRPEVTTPPPLFDLLILGNLTTPLPDRRRGRIVEDTGELLCDFANNFPCLWGPEVGKWGVIKKGAIPSLKANIPDGVELPTYPAAVVIQGAAMLTSDPIRCQTGEGKLLFRYWTNSRVLMQVCAMGNYESTKIQCVEELTKNSDMDDATLAVFALSNSIREPFTLNIIPIWERNSRNSYMVIDEIAYIGECNASRSDVNPHLQQLLSSATQASSSENVEQGGSLSANSNGSRRPSPSSGAILPPTSGILEFTGPPEVATSRSSGRRTHEHTWSSVEKQIFSSTSATPFSEMISSSRTSTSQSPSRTRGTRYPYSPTPPTTSRPRTLIVESISTQVVPPIDNVGELVDVVELNGNNNVNSNFNGRAGLGKTPSKGSFTIPYTTTQHYQTTTDDDMHLDYCKILNCDFNDNACNYLNHGLTKLPWTLRSKGYGFPLSRHTDLRPTASNGQFVSTVLGPGDFAILESPHFNITQGINVLLFQYYRPTHSSTIRLCMGTRYTKPYRTIAAFLQCPPILRSLTSRNAFRWNSVHIQLPPGTTHFFLVAHNMERSNEKAAIAIDNIRVAICDPRTYSPESVDELLSEESRRNNNDEEIYRDEEDKEA